METLTLTDVIQEECKDPTFNQHFQHELLINEIAQLVVDTEKSETDSRMELLQAKKK